MDEVLAVETQEEDFPNCYACHHMSPGNLLNLLS
jgi:hypothetical protein